MLGSVCLQYPVASFQKLALGLASLCELYVSGMLVDGSGIEHSTVGNAGRPIFRPSRVGDVPYIYASSTCQGDTGPI